MLSNDIGGYVFSKDMRFLNRWAIPAAAAVLCCFAAAFLIAIFGGDVDVLAHMIAAVLFAGIAVCLLFWNRRWSDLLWMRYQCGRKTVKNLATNGTARWLSVQGLVCITTLSAEFSAKGAIWHEQYYVLSDAPIPENSHSETVGLQQIRKMRDQGYLILPVNEQTECWTAEVLGITGGLRYGKRSIGQWK